MAAPMARMWLRRALWLLGLWIAGVAALGLIALLLRLALGSTVVASAHEAAAVSSASRTLRPIPAPARPVQSAARPS